MGTQSVQVLQDYLNPGTFEIYNELLTRSLLGISMVQISHTCPREDCGFRTSALVEVKDRNTSSISCGGCPYVYCTKCRQSAHSGKCKFCFEHFSQILHRIKNSKDDLLIEDIV